MPTITVKVPLPLAERLTRTVLRSRSTRSPVVLAALEAHLAADGGGAGTGRR
jgi:hypothetical protein